jgi:hypothetical protein
MEQERLLLISFVSMRKWELDSPFYCSLISPVFLHGTACLEKIDTSKNAIQGTLSIVGTFISLINGSLKIRFLLSIISLNFDSDT